MGFILKVYAEKVSEAFIAIRHKGEIRDPALLRVACGIPELWYSTVAIKSVMIQQHIKSLTVELLNHSIQNLKRVQSRKICIECGIDARRRCSCQGVRADG